VTFPRRFRVNYLDAQLARVMGTSVLMIERSYGTLLDGASADIASRLDAFEAQQQAARESV
jgi:hypothetical protein